MRATASSLSERVSESMSKNVKHLRHMFSSLFFTLFMNGLFQDIIFSGLSLCSPSNLNLCFSFVSRLHTEIVYSPEDGHPSRH